MRPEDVPAAMAEAAARRICERGAPEFWPGWNSIDDEAKDHFRGFARDYLAAALSVCTASKVWTDPRPGHGDYRWMFWSPVIPRRPESP
jgi:hypothetical protein